MINTCLNSNPLTACAVIRFTASSSADGKQIVPLASRKRSRYSKSSASSPVFVIAFFSQFCTNSRITFSTGDFVSRANWRMMSSRESSLLSWSRLIASRICCNASSTATPPSTSAKTVARLAFFTSLGIDLIRLRRFSGSIVNCGRAATRNRLALSAVETTAPKQANRSRACGVSITSMFSIENGMPCSANSVAS